MDNSNLELNKQQNVNRKNFNPNSINNSIDFFSELKNFKKDLKKNCTA